MSQWIRYFIYFKEFAHYFQLILQGIAPSKCDKEINITVNSPILSSAQVTSIVKKKEEGELLFVANRLYCGIYIKDVHY